MKRRTRKVRRDAALGIYRHCEVSLVIYIGLDREAPLGQGPVSTFESSSVCSGETTKRFTRTGGDPPESPQIIAGERPMLKSCPARDMNYNFFIFSASIFGLFFSSVFRDAARRSNAQL